MYKVLYNKSMKVGVFCNSQTKKFFSIRDGLLKIFKARGIDYETYFAPEEISSPDVLIVLGGDGTILKAAIEAGKRGINLLGINSGNLGFLTEFEGEQIEKAVDLISGHYEVEERSVLEVRAGSEAFFALNEAVFQRRYEEGADDNVVQISAYIDGKKVDAFVGDGIIVSTPTGSTAYSLSAGGSILTPDIRAFILTPICAHSLHNRPIVYSDASEMRVDLSAAENKVSLFCDGKFCGAFGKGSAIHVKKAGFSVRFIKSADNNFFDKLLFKLNKWSGQREVRS